MYNNGRCETNNASYNTTKNHVKNGTKHRGPLQYDDANRTIHVGYFVDDDDDDKAYWFAEVFLSGQSTPTFYRSGGSGYTDGSNKVFAVHEFNGVWSFYVGTGSSDVVAQYTTDADTYNTADAKAMHEKGCGGGCIISEMGNSPDVIFTKAM